MGVERQQSGFYQRSLFEGLEENPRPEPGWRSPQPICPERGATSVRGVGSSTSLECEPDGGGDQTGQPKSSVSPSAGEQRRCGCGRHVRRGPASLDWFAQG